MNKDEKIMLHHAESGKFGSNVDFLNEIDLGIKIDEQKKEIILADCKNYSSFKNVFKLYKDYLVVCIKDDKAINFGLAKQLLEKVNSKVIALHFLEKDFEAVKGFIDYLQTDFLFENSNKSFEDLGK